MKSLIIILGLLTLNSLQAKELTVIYDSGDTLSIAPYLPKPAQRTLRQKQNKSKLPFTLPITTPSMQPGKVPVTSKSLKYLRRPVFLVGSDKASQHWLKANRDKLIQIGAMGLLIKAKTLNDIETMLTIAREIKLIPASAESISKQLGLTNYPVLISKEGWEQ